MYISRGGGYFFFIVMTLSNHYNGYWTPNIQTIFFFFSTIHLFLFSDDFSNNVHVTASTSFFTSIACCWKSKPGETLVYTNSKTKTGYGDNIWLASGLFINAQVIWSPHESSMMDILYCRTIWVFDQWKLSFWSCSATDPYQVQVTFPWCTAAQL